MADVVVALEKIDDSFRVNNSSFFCKNVVIFLIKMDNSRRSDLVQVVEYQKKEIEKYKTKLRGLL